MTHSPPSFGPPHRRLKTPGRRALRAAPGAVVALGLAGPASARTRRPAPFPVDAPASPAVTRPAPPSTAPSTQPATTPPRAPGPAAAQLSWFHSAPRPPATAPVAARPVPVPISAPLRAQIERLSSDNYQSRRQAVDAIVALGDDVLPQLDTAVAQAADPEVDVRLQAAIARLLDLRQVGPSLITLDLDHVPASRAFEEVARQARAPLPTEPPDLFAGKSGRTVSLHVDHRPFWEVMELICKQADVEPTSLSRQGREAGLGLTRAARDWTDKPTVRSGPVLLRADSLTHNASLSLRDPNENTSEFSVNFIALAEPKLKVLDYSGTARVDEAVDDRGNSLLPPDDNGVSPNVESYGNNQGGRPAQWSVGATLEFPKRPGTRIVRLRGSVSFIVQTRSARLELPVDTTKPVTADLEGIRVRVDSVDPQRANILIFRDGRGDADWYRLRLLLSGTEAQLVGDKGQVVARSQIGVEVEESNDSQQMELRLRFGRGDDPDDGPRRPRESREARDTRRHAAEGGKFVWEIPIETREVVVPFIYRDLPIPR